MSDKPTVTKGGSEDQGASPASIPDFELIRWLDKGGFGEVWLARSRSGVYRAVKLVPKGVVTDIEFQGIHAYETHARDHPNLIDIRHVGETKAFFYYVMELADGYQTAPTFSPEDYEPRTLKADLKRRGGLTLEEALTITRQVLDGLAHLHHHELLHRDIKPGNILFVDGLAKLADIGLVTQERRREDDGYTPLYAPEGGVTDRSGDLYCLGRVLYEMVSGTRPDRYPEFPAEADAERRQAIRRILPVLDRVGAPNPKERLESVEQFVHALDQAVGKPTASVGPEPKPKRSGVSRRAVLYALAGIAVVAALLIFGPRFGERPARSGTLDILYKEHRDALVYYRVEPDSLPLRTGELIKLHATLDPPSYPVIAVISEADGVQIAYPDEENLASQSPVQELDCPVEGRWWPLSPPDGTLTFVMLAGEHPIHDEDELERTKNRLAALKGLPTVRSDTMIRLVNGQFQRFQGRPDRTRGIGDVRESVQSADGMLTQLPQAFADSFSVITAVAVPQVTVPVPADSP